jgi:hypothetical protein
MNPSLAMLPCAFDTGKLYSVLPDTGAGDFTVSRNGSATFLGSNGLLQTAAANEPRLEFNTDGSFRGVLVEPAATNLLLRSEEFGDSYWIKTRLRDFGSGSIANTIETLDPAGTNTADYIQQESGQNNYGVVSRIVVITTTHTWSIFAKKKEKNFIVVFTEANVQTWFNLNNGTVGQKAASHTAVIKDYGDGWYRCIITANTGVRFNIYLADTDGSTTVTDSGGVYLWGAQLEVGSVATSYIPTVATTITRPSDIITVQEPVGISEIKTTLNGTESTVSPTGGTYQLPNGRVSRVLML